MVGSGLAFRRGEASDATYQFKVDFLRKHDMVVFRFHDHWHARRPDGIATGMVRELGWEKNADPKDARVLFPLIPELETPPNIYPLSLVCFIQVSSSSPEPPNDFSHCFVPIESIFTIQ